MQQYACEFSCHGGATVRVSAHAMPVHYVYIKLENNIEVRRRMVYSSTSRTGRPVINLGASQEPMLRFSHMLRSCERRRARICLTPCARVTSTQKKIMSASAAAKEMRELLMNAFTGFNAKLENVRIYISPRSEVLLPLAFQSPLFENSCKSFQFSRTFVLEFFGAGQERFLLKLCLACNEFFFLFLSSAPPPWPSACALCFCITS